MKSMHHVARAVLRWVALMLMAATLAACGGGGGDGGDGDGDGVHPIGGDWQLVVSADGEAGPAVDVRGVDVPTAQQVSAITTANLAQLLGATSFQDYTVTINGSVITLTGPGTRYTLVITSLATSGYQGCGTCGVGSTVSYNVHMAYTESGTLDGQAVPAGSGAVSVNLRYLRRS